MFVFFFFFILFLLGVVSICVFSFCLLGCLLALVTYGLSQCVVYDQMMVLQSQQFYSWNLTAVREEEDGAEWMCEARVLLPEGRRLCSPLCEAGEGRAEQGACYFTCGAVFAVGRKKDPCYLCLCLFLLFCSASV